jgi:YHS domain-containing protein
MKKSLLPVALLSALAVVLVIGAVAQQKSADKAIDPVCGMSVVKADAPATFEYKGTTYYFCSSDCKETFVKDPEKCLEERSDAKASAPMGQMGMMGHQGMASCPMMQGAMPKGARMMGRMGMAGQGMMTGPGLGRMFRLYGDKIEMTVENTKDGAVLKATSKDPEVVKAIQVHMAEHKAMMKMLKEEAVKK